jgi:CubicO group peptidase (beta-lactamase class C family)
MQEDKTNRSAAIKRLCRIAALITYAVCGFGAGSGAAEIPSDAVALEKVVADVVEPYLFAESEDRAEEKKDKTPAARARAIVVGVVSKEGRHTFGFGRLSDDSPTRPDGRTLFEIGSITKTFTALLLADSVERGKAKLDDPARLYLPESVTMPKRGEKEITLMHLATHTSAIPRLPPAIHFTGLFSNNPYKDYNTESLYRTLAGMKLTRDPGAHFQYSNLAYGLLGHLLCRASDKAYEELVVERICRPLGMTDTRVVLDEDQQNRLAAPYENDGAKASNWDFDVLAGAGALRSTTNDMLGYVEANMGFKKSHLLPAMRLCHEPRYPTDNKIQSICLGWHSEKRGENSRLVFHGGGTGGYSTLAGFMEENGQPRFGVVVLSNAAPGTRGMVANDVAVKLIDVLSEP